tara:strand:+ start:154 stop:522 length:369 start_codon:yes stop_codon:yes gene_type:complete
MDTNIDHGKLLFSEKFEQENNLIVNKDDIIKEIREVYDPEIPVNIYELGLIYKIDISDNHEVKIIMTLTSPNCPAAQSLPEDLIDRVKTVKGIKGLSLYLTFDPPWKPDMMSEEAKLALGIE